MFRVLARFLYRSVRQVSFAVFRMRRAVLETKLRPLGVKRINLCSGPKRIPGYLGIDVIPGCDLQLDLSRYDLPFGDNSLQVVVCMSAINYFTRTRGEQLIREVFRVLVSGGICRMGVQDMRTLAERYLRNDREFFFQKLADGRERFEGPTLGDKFAAWFYGYAVGKNRCQYFYDYDSLAHVFVTAGFSVVERKAYRESRISDVDQLDNRPEQMFYIEAIK